MAGRFSVETVFKGIDRLSAPVSRMQNSVSKFTRSASDGLTKLSKRFDGISGGIKSATRSAAIGVGALTAALAPVLSTGAEFEQTLVNAAAKFPGEIRRGTAEFKALEEAARRTGSTTEFSASQSAEALNFLAMAGFNAENAIAALPGVVDLATAASMDLATATDVASDSLGAFNLMSKDSEQLARNLQRVNDVIARTTTSANTTVEALFETIKDGAPVATTAGASIETFAALSGVLANAGIKASRAGTTLKNTFLTLSAPTGGAAKILKRLGIQTQDANGDMRDIVAILGDLNKALDGLGTAERSGVLEGIFGKIPIAGVNVLLAAGADELNKYRASLERASGASATMAATMRDTVQGRINSLKSAIEGVSISIFSMTDGPLAEAIDRMTDWVRTNEDLIATNVGQFIADLINNFESIVGWLKIIGVSLVSFYALNTLLQTFIGIMTAVNLVMALNPIGLIVLGVIALIAGLTALVVWIDDVVAGFESMNPVLQLLLAPFGLLIKGIKYIKDNIGVVGDIASAVGGWFSSDEEDQPQADGMTGAAVISPGARIAQSINETRTTSTSELVIKDDTGRAQPPRGGFPAGISMVQTGGF